MEVPRRRSLISRWLSLRWRIQARYWKRRAFELERQLKAERYRNLAREDTFASAAVLGARNMFGLAPRGGPAPLTAKNVTPQQSFDPMAGLSSIEKAEFQTYWLPDALRANVSEAAALISFRAELAQRRSIRDEGSVS